LKRANEVATAAADENLRTPACRCGLVDRALNGSGVDSGAVPHGAVIPHIENPHLWPVAFRRWPWGCNGRSESRCKACAKQQGFTPVERFPFHSSLLF